MARLQLTLVVGAAATAMLLATPARASIAYAYMLATAFDFGKGCQACHTDDAGGLGTVTKPFGKTLMKYGLKANDTDSLEEAVTQLSVSDDDSDGDMIADFDELAPDGDPNDPTVFPEGATPITPTPPTGTTPTPTTAPSTTPPSTTPPSTTAPSTTAPPGSDPVPSPTTTPSATPPGAPTASTASSGGGCGVAPSNVSGSSAGVLALLALLFSARRRR